jgi:hypothetical protein
MRTASFKFSTQENPGHFHQEHGGMGRVISESSFRPLSNVDPTLTWTWSVIIVQSSGSGSNLQALGLITSNNSGFFNGQLRKTT